MIIPTLTGPAAVPDNLLVSVSPATTSQSSPGAVTLTATATGGTGATSVAWSAKYADGTSAAALLSTASGSSTVVTTTTPGQSVRVVATATDSGSPAQVATGSAMVAVAQPALPTLTGPSPSTLDAPGSGSVTFTGANGYGSLSYSAALSKPSGSAATLSGSGLGPYTFTTDLEGSYAVTLTLTDGLSRTAQATGIVSLVSAGAIWTEAIREDFTTYDAATVSRTSSTGTTLTSTVNLQKAGVTQYVATLGVTFSGGSSGTGTGGIDASGMFITQSGAVTRASFTIAPTTDTTKWQMYQWLVDMPSFSGTTVNGGPTLQSSASPSTGTEIAPLMVTNNATAGLFDFQALMRLSNVSQTPFGVHASAAANPGRVCVTLVCRGKESLTLLHDSDTFIPAQSIDTGPYHAAMSVTANDTTFSSSYALMVTTPNFGVRIGTAAGTIRVREMRVLYATPRSS